MNRQFAIVVTLLMWVSIVDISCSTSPSSSSSFNWSVDSRPYQAVPLGLTYSNETRNTFSGFTCNMGQSVTIATSSTSVQFHTGLYSSPFNPSTGSSSAPDAFAILINEGLAAQSGGPGPFWVASAGTLTITAIDGSHVAGSFDVTLAPASSSTETGTAHGTGTFDVPPFTSTGNLCGEAAVR